MLSRRVAAVLRGRKAELQVTDQQIGDATGISQEQISRFLKPSRVMSIEQTAAICDYLGLDLSAALNGERLVRRDREPPTDPEIHPEDERLIDESDKLTRSQRSELKATLRGGPASERPMSDRLHPAKSVSSSARRRGRAGA